jgi:hypothetical protein
MLFTIFEYNVLSEEINENNVPPSKWRTPPDY